MPATEVIRVAGNFLSYQDLPPVCVKRVGIIYSHLITSQHLPSHFRDCYQDT